MITVGLDVGSTSAKAVVLQNCRILSTVIAPTGWSPREAGQAVMEQALAQAGMSREQVDKIVGTGYGRVSMDFLDKAVTEITCHALGANYYFKDNPMVIDIGGQDSKVICLTKEGKVTNFVMNDKCAAGTGRFLQVTINSLGLDLKELDSLPAAEPARINSMCTVFAESEVISLLAAGTAKEAIVAGLLAAIAKRVATMAGSVGVNGPITFTGGVAQCDTLRGLLAKELKTDIVVPPNPQIVGALGAALVAQG